MMAQEGKAEGRETSGSNYGRKRLIYNPDCTLESPGKLLDTPAPQDHPRTIAWQSLEPHWLPLICSSIGSRCTK